MGKAHAQLPGRWKQPSAHLAVIMPPRQLLPLLFTISYQVSHLLYNPNSSTFNPKSHFQKFKLKGMVLDLAGVGDMAHIGTLPLQPIQNHDANSP
jgi:hypothetical protein